MHAARLDATRRFDRDLASFGETPTSFARRDPDGHEVELYVTKPR